MRVFVQIPCLNEAETLAKTISEIPRQIPGVTCVIVVVIDDGSTDDTAKVAFQGGADYVIRHLRNRGLAEAFRTGLDACLRLGADVIVNTDGDGQYRGSDIPQLIAPIVDGDVEIVIGDRETAKITHFAFSKRLLQKLGSSLVRKLSGTDVPDVVSGLRAFSRNAAFQINVVNSFSYTIETVMQIGDRKLAVAAVPVGSNLVMRKSRLFNSLPEFLRKSATVILRSYTMYRPLGVFVKASSIFCSLGAIPIARFLYYYIFDGGAGHIQSLVLGSALLCIGFTTLVLGIVGDLVACNRRLLEQTLEKVRRIEAGICPDGLRNTSDANSHRCEIAEPCE